MDRELVLVVSQEARDAGALEVLATCLRGTPWVRVVVDRRRPAANGGDPPVERRARPVLECHAVVRERPDG